MQAACFARVFIHGDLIAAVAGEFAELPQHVVEEEREPDAFALAVLADQIHAVVPVAAADQRQVVNAETQAVVHGADAMFVKCRNLIGNLRQVVIRFLIGPQGPLPQKRDGFVEDAGVAGGDDVTAQGVRQPEIIVGEVRAHASADRRVPPVLHVPFLKLPRGGAEQMLAQQARLGMNEGHRILQLIAEAERPAGLVEPGASPHPARERLIDEPAVGQEIDGRLRRFNVDHAKRTAPVVPDAFEGAIGVAGAAEALH